MTGLKRCCNTTICGCKSDTWWSIQVATSYAATSNVIWSNWSSNSVTQTGTSAGNMAFPPAISFVSGTNGTIIQSVINDIWVGWTKKYHETKDQKEARLAQERLRAQQQAEAAARQRVTAEQAMKVEAAARVRANKLLVKHLTLNQKETLEKFNYFDVEVGAKTYRIKRGTHGNVKELDRGGNEVASFCIQPPGIPTEDAMLSQMFLLKHEEAEFLRIANKTVLRVPQPGPLTQHAMDIARAMPGRVVQVGQP